MEKKNRHLLSVLLLLTSTLYSTAFECKKSNEQPYRCTNHQVLEPRCTGILPSRCEARQAVCRCVPNKFRNSLGECDDESKCTQPSAKTVEVAREREQKNIQIYNYTLQVIESTDALSLLTVFRDAPERQNCKCMKSMFLRGIEKGAERTLDCYHIANLQNRPNVMIKSTAQINFVVIKDNSETHIQLTSASGGQLPFHLKEQYEVLAAQETCLVLKIGQREDGKKQCMLWGLINDNEKHEEECFAVITHMCAENFDVWEQSTDCWEHDNLAQSARQKLDKKQT